MVVFPNRMRNSKISFWHYGFISIFILLCGPVIKISANIYIDTALVYAMMITFWSVLSDKKIIIDQPVIVAILVFAAYILFVCIPMHFVNSNERLPYAEILKPIKIFFYATAIRYLANKFRTIENINFLSFTSASIFYGITINSIFIICETFLPDFRLFLFEYFKGGVDLNEQIANRAGGLLLSGGAIASGFSGIGILFGFYLLLSPNKKFLGLTVLSIAINLIGAILSGRTGIIIALISVLYFFLQTRNKIRFLFYLGVFVFVLSFAIMQLYSSILIQDNQNLYISLSRFAVFLNGYFGTDLETSFTIDERIEDFLLGSLKIPNEPLQFLFGLISFSNWNYNSKISDMGFQITLFRYGFVGIFIFYLIYLISFFKIILKKNVNYFVVVIFLILFLLETKEATMYARGLIVIMFLAYEMSFISQLQQKNIGI